MSSRSSFFCSPVVGIENVANLAFDELIRHNYEEK